MIQMIPISVVIWVALVEAMIFWTIHDYHRPDKKTRENIREFAEDYNMSERAAKNWILRNFFKAYENGLKVKMRAAYQKNNPSFEEWKAEQDRKFEEDLQKLKEQKQVVKPKKIHPHQ